MLARGGGGGSGGDTANNNLVYPWAASAGWLAGALIAHKNSSRIVSAVRCVCVLAEADLITLKASDIAANYIGRFVSSQAPQALSGFIAQCADNCDGDFGSLVATHEEKPLELWRPFLCFPTDLFTRARLNVADSHANTRNELENCIRRKSNLQFQRLFVLRRR